MFHEVSIPHFCSNPDSDKRQGTQFLECEFQEAKEEVDRIRCAIGFQHHENDECISNGSESTAAVILVRQQEALRSWARTLFVIGIAKFHYELRPP